MGNILIDSFMTLANIMFFIIEVFTSNPVIIGFLRIRCAFKLPFIFSLRTILFDYNKVRWFRNNFIEKEICCTLDSKRLFKKNF